MSQHLESSRQQEALFVGKFFMNFPSKSRSTVKQNVSKRIATSKSGASLDQNKTTTTVDPTRVGGNISRLNTSTDDSLRTNVELLNPPTNSSTDLLKTSCESDAEGCSLQERSDTFSIPSKESGSQPFLSAHVIADSSSSALENFT